MKKKNRFDIFSSPLLRAVECDDLPMLVEAIDAGENIEVLDRAGCTPLIRAATLGFEELVKYLIKSGAAINAMDDDGWTALHYVAQNGHSAIAHFLIAEGAEVDAINKYGNTPLFNAIFNYTKDGNESYRVFLEAGASLDAKNNAGVSPRDLTECDGMEELEIYKIKGVRLD
ncbi:ankyrin repeat domain-containing protein [Deefgea piscis]|uniref:Ankyrin repeat domain-containing protein n=1 Tax=Deefgea piscis TaxID=2739061 RepID=A0A6M8SUW3_9NEIS|nr:ankyrin repeat domain-containing protein [Deefgea piscis]QKJ67934.1 ankyrin repeat domain-containing protein [Deefgea piscis]